MDTPNGKFYGTTEGGGANGAGAIFEITAGGTLRTLYSFCQQSNCADGEVGGALLQGTDGNFYGTTGGGGTNGDGTLFKITPSGTLTTLHGMDGTDGEHTHTLAEATDGTFYGAAEDGGANNDGTIFALSVDLSPFVETVPAFGKFGTLIKILGTNLTGATSVTFNGAPATFKVVSPTLISGTVPAGATTGFVTVTTPSGTLKSKVKFRVRP